MAQSRKRATSANDSGHSSATKQTRRNTDARTQTSLESAEGSQQEAPVNEMQNLPENIPHWTAQKMSVVVCVRMPDQPISHSEESMCHQHGRTCSLAGMVQLPL